MTWKELKEKIEKMPIEQQELEVLCWGEEKPLTPMTLDVCSEDMYFGYDWDCCYPESDLGPNEKDDESAFIYAKKGTHYLWVE